MGVRGVEAERVRRLGLPAERPRRINLCEGCGVELFPLNPLRKCPECHKTGDAGAKEYK